MTEPNTPPFRGYGATLLIGLVGAVAAVIAVTRPWFNASARVEGLPVITTSVSGSALVPAASALGFVVLAAFGAVIATRGWVRRALGVLIVVAAAVVLVLAVHPGSAHDALADGLAAKGWTGGGFASSSTWWRWLTAVGAVLALGAGAAVVRFGHGWATMGSRYDSPAARSRKPDLDNEAAMWKAIDEGEDPTERR